MVKGILSADTAVEILSVELAKGGLYPFFRIDEDEDIEVEFGSHMPNVVMRVVGQRLAIAVQWQRVVSEEAFVQYFNLVKACTRAGYTIDPLVTGTEELLNPRLAAQWLRRTYETLYQQSRDLYVAALQVDRRHAEAARFERIRQAKHDKKQRRLATSTGLNYGSTR